MAAPAGGANMPVTTEPVTTDHETERPAPAAATRPRPQLWRLNVLGPVELCYDGRVVEVSGPTRTLLAMLARNPGAEIGTPDIIAGMWGSEPPEDAEKEVASHVSRLRKALTVVAPDEQPTTIVVTMPQGYILDITPSNADTLAFERSVTDGRRALSVGQPALALTRLDAGLALWRGPAFADFGDHAIVRTEAARLEDLRLAAVESRVDALLALAAPAVPDGLVEELRTLAGQYWHRERFWAQLMIVLARTGRRAEALAAFREAADRLADRLGAAPGADLRATERAVIAADPTLAGGPPRRPVVPEPLAATVPACVGREEEIEWLLAALDLAATRRAQGRLVVGSTGIGKSRLVAALAQRAVERDVAINHFRADTRDLDTITPPADRLSLVIVEDLDQGAHEDVARVADFLRSAPTRPVVVVVTCRDPVRVGDLAGLPKLVLSALDDQAVAQIVRVYAPSATDATASSAMINAGGVPAKVHRAASEWAFGRAGRRIDRAVADAAEPVRRLSFLRDEVIGGVHDLAHVRAQARPLRAAAQPPVPEPYRGLVTLGPNDAEVFHGREQLVAELVARLVGARLLAVVGDVGTGTSSVVLAGLLPALRGGALPDSAQWRTVVLTPADVVGRSLAELLVELAETDEPGDALELDPEEADFPAAAGEAVVADPMEPAFGSGEPGPTELADESTADGPVLLVVDQFEEAFTALDGPARAELVETMVATAGTGRVVLTLRSDFYGRCAEHPELASLVTANTVLVGPMTGAELRQAIVAPAVAAGLRVETGPGRAAGDRRRSGVGQPGPPRRRPARGVATRHRRRAHAGHVPGHRRGRHRGGRARRAGPGRPADRRRPRAGDPHPGRAHHHSGWSTGPAPGAGREVPAADPGPAGRAPAGHRPRGTLERGDGRGRARGAGGALAPAAGRARRRGGRAQPAPPPGRDRGQLGRARPGLGRPLPGRPPGRGDGPGPDPQDRAGHRRARLPRRQPAGGARGRDPPPAPGHPAVAVARRHGRGRAAGGGGRRRRGLPAVALHGRDDPGRGPAPGHRGAGRARPAPGPAAGGGGVHGGRWDDRRHPGRAAAGGRPARQRRSGRHRAGREP